MAAELTSGDACYALDLVKTICAEIGPGLPGSRQERERGSIIRREMQAHLGAPNVSIEEFTLAPGAFVGSLTISGLCLLAAAGLNIVAGRSTGFPAWLTAAAALAGSIAAIASYIGEFTLYKELVDPLFSKARSANVVGALRPENAAAKRLLIISGHHDSAPENTWLRFLGYGFFLLVATAFIAFAVMLAVSAAQLAGIISGHVGMTRVGTLGWALLAWPVVPAIIYLTFFARGRQGGGTVPGAMDNLAASALLVVLARFLVQHPEYMPPDTEIRFISFGSEEAGVRGSLRYVERHLDELKRLDVRMLNFEMIAYPQITILSSDLNGSVKNAPEMVRSAVAAAQRARVPFKVGSGSLGVGTDAGSFSRSGLKATTLLPFKMPQQMVAFYHQKWDTPEILSAEPLTNVLKLALEWVRCGGD